MKKLNLRRIVCSKRMLPQACIEPVFATIYKECVLSLTKQYSTITPFPDEYEKE